MNDSQDRKIEHDESHATPSGADSVLSFHPLANLFPISFGEDLQALAKDIQENGLHNPITLFEGKILDGRCRYRACEIAGLAPLVTQYAGDNPLAFVVSHNLHRRHLNESQRAMVAARLADLQCGANQHSKGLPIGTAAKIFNVSERSTARAREVLRQGSLELQEDVTSGKITVSSATNQLRQSSSNQNPLTAGREHSAKAALYTLPASTAPSIPSAANGEGLAPPPPLDRRSPQEVYDSLKASWANSPGFVAAWAEAPLVIRERFIVEFLQCSHYRRSKPVELIKRRASPVASPQ